MGLTVRQALNINGLKRAIVVTGFQGLDNEIQFPVLRKTLIYNLARKKVAAFGLKPGQYLSEIPQDMIECADDVGLPLLELPPD